MTKTVLVPISVGVEEIELACIVDVLRRAGAKVTVVSDDDKEVVASRGMKISPDITFKDCKDEDFDLIVLPGGMPGAEHLRDCDPLIAQLKKQIAAGRLVGAICAAPYVVLHHHGFLKECKKTAYPNMISKMENGVDEKVVVDKNCITSQGPGTALLFAVKLIELLFDKSKAKEIAKDLLL